MAERKQPETKYRNPSNKVLQSTGTASISTNKHSLVALALYGSQDKAEVLLTEVHRTIRRLSLRTGKIKSFGTPPRGHGAPPNIHDIIPWLNSLTRNSGDVEFMKRLYKTLTARVPASFVESLDG